jgi:arabinose-5-phosphate isomerase
VMREMSAKGLGAAAVVDAQGHLQGVFTDGDLRRKIEAGIDLRSTTARELMSAKPRTIRDDVLAAEAVSLMEAHRINTLLVVDAAGQLVGAVSTNDLMRAKVI